MAFKPQLLKPRDLGTGEILIGEVRKRRTPPKTQTLAQQACGGGRVTCRRTSVRLRDEALKTARVDLLRPRRQNVAARSEGNRRLGAVRPVRVERLPQPRDVALERV